jgi:hypothetical protein
MVNEKIYVQNCDEWRRGTDRIIQTAICNRVLRVIASQARAALGSVDRAAGRKLPAGWARRVRVGLAPCSNDLRCRDRAATLAILTRV